MQSISIVIPNYNGEDLLKENIPPLLKSLQRTNAAWEVIVVDDGSKDGSVRFLQENHPDVKVMVNEVNRGFAETMNRGIEAAQYDVVFSLNSDVTVEVDAIPKLLRRFEDPDLFAVSPNIIDPRDGRNQASYRLIQGYCWFIDRCIQRFPEELLDKEIPIFFASGGATCYDRKKLLQLGGFPTIYHPFYIEDVDLSYQGWKAGWKCLLEPRATVWHKSSSTIKNYNWRRKIKFITARNKNIFLWINISDRKLIFRYFLLILPSLLLDILLFRKYKLVGTFMALAKFPDIIRERRRRRFHWKVGDRQVIDHVRLTQDQHSLC